MPSRPQQLITSLQLAPHPEGGHFREVYRSASQLQPADERGERAALTTIYFLLSGAEVSRWHRVASDEVWHFYEGEPLELYTADERFEQVECHLLGPMDAGGQWVRVVPAGHWQAARPRGQYTLVGCTVGPGFDFADFQMLSDLPAAAGTVKRGHPELARFV